MSEYTYRPAWWLPGPHARTIWSKFFHDAPPVVAREERWETPDGDFVELLRLEGERAAPHVLLLHGLEGTPRSHYVRGMFAELGRRGWGLDLLLFRSCGSEMNRARRFYHSGETSDLAFAIERLIAERPQMRLGLAGFSLGGNVLLKWLGERGADLPRQLCGAAAVSVPFDLARSARQVDHGFARVYQAHFLRTLRRKARQKLVRFPDLFDQVALDHARSLHDFDDAVTAPVHGFRDADDYYERSSALRFLAGIRLPTLLLSAVDDPFLPADVLDDVRAAASRNPALQTEFIERGGHVGFVTGAPWNARYYAEWRVADFLSTLCR